MAKTWTLDLISGVLAAKKFYWLQKKDVPYNLTGKTVKLRIKPTGQNEITLQSPIVQISNAVAGEISINFTDEIVDAYTFSKAEILLQVDDRIIQTGILKIRKWYD